MLDQEGAHGLSLMGREIVRDDVNRSPFGLTGNDVAEEVDKRLTRVPRHGLPEHFASLGIEGGEERERAVPVVLEAMSLSPARRERQHEGDQQKQEQRRDQRDCPQTAPAFGPFEVTCEIGVARHSYSSVRSA